MALRDDILAAFPALPAGRDDGAIAAALSAGRTRATDLEIGNGTILETIGLTAGNALIDAIHATAAMKYVIPLLDQGRLKIGSALVQGAIDSFVSANVITTEQGAALKALGNVPDPVTPQMVAAALEGYFDGHS